jgi:crotonobetainyl-CoA:carnitine CoA-transferase CaiB-like acyl-CoA transferase
VLVENFKTGTMEKWGLGFDALHARFPRLVHCRVSGFGADGPKGGLPGYDAAIQAMVGLMSINGETDANGGQPVRMGVPVVDLFTGLNAALGILLALK